MPRCLMFMVGVTLSAWGCMPTVFGQSLPPAERIDVTKPRQTTVELDLVAGREGVGLIAQQWRPILERIGVPFRIRSSVIEVNPETTERMRGRLRQVVVTARLTSDGDLVFADRTISRGQNAELQEWLKELKTYGAQGAPNDKPLWGLSESQFHPLMRQLAEPFADDPTGKSFSEAIEQFAIEGCLLNASVDAVKIVDAAPAVRASQDVSGVATGAALAITLKEFGLGFRPQRTPAGTIELLIEPLTTESILWPIGWKLEASRQQAAPKLFALVYIELPEISLADVIAGLPEVVEVPVLVDRAQLTKENVDLAGISVKYPGRQTSWSIALRSLTAQGKLVRELWVDESGSPFLWITTAKAHRFQISP